MKKFEINLAREHQRNRAYLNRLSGFVSSPRFEYLDYRHKEAMIRQLEAMQELDAALTCRMELLGLPL